MNKTLMLDLRSDPANTPTLVKMVTDALEGLSGNQEMGIHTLKTPHVLIQEMEAMGYRASILQMGPQDWVTTFIRVEDPEADASDKETLTQDKAGEMQREIELSMAVAEPVPDEETGTND
ncbi:MAG: hypothetical protein V4498_02190 [candidate division FCPU426 bacterium]